MLGLRLILRTLQVGSPHVCPLPLPLPLPQATDPLQTEQVLEEAKLRMQEEMERRANAKEADVAMDKEKIR